MDSVPLDFSERVLATRKCCEQKRRCSCRSSRFAAQMWNQQKEPMRLAFYIYGNSGGKWKYEFRNVNSSKTLSLDEVMRVKSAHVWYCHAWDDNLYLHDVEDMEKLLKVVSFLSNEPRLYVHWKDQFFGCSQGEKVLRWLEKSWFSYVYVQVLAPVHRKIIENQFLRWKPTRIDVGWCHKSATFVENWLMSGNLRLLRLKYSAFSAKVLQKIISNVLDNPEGYRTNGLDIIASFDDSAWYLMAKMTKNGRRIYHEGEDQIVTRRNTLDDQLPVLTVERLSGCWRLRSRFREREGNAERSPPSRRKKLNRKVR